MGNVFAFSWEIPFMEWLQSIDISVLPAIFVFFTNIGGEVVLVALLGCIYWSIDKEKGKRIATGMSLALITGPLIKNIAIRRRPYMDHPSVACLKAPGKGSDIYDIKTMGYSFPSMHSADSSSFYASLIAAFKKKWLRVLSVIVIFCVGLSRVYLGVHYPTDVLAGWIIGIVSVAVTPVILRHIKSYLQLAIIIGLVALPGWFYCTSNDFFSAYGVVMGLLLGFYIEESLLPFEDALDKGLVTRILRAIIPLLVFLLLCEGIKTVVPAHIREADNLWGHLYYYLRYFISSIIPIGVLPGVVFKRLHFLAATNSELKN